MPENFLVIDRNLRSSHRSSVWVDQLITNDLTERDGFFYPASTFAQE
jgi:hypothetical protein